MVCGYNFSSFLFTLERVLRCRVPDLSELEGLLDRFPSSIKGDSNSPERFVFSNPKMPSLVSNVIEGFMEFPLHFSIMSNIVFSYTSLLDNPENPKVEADYAFISKLIRFSRRIGVNAIGFAKVPKNFIFKNRKILYDNAIILIMEMDKRKISKAPSKETEKMIFETYNNLGIAANKLAIFLRRNGYAAQAVHPMGAPILYPPLAELASLGYHGSHGLIITPWFGPRVRIASVLTSIENLPYPSENPHVWIKNFCKICRVCIKLCPGKAILDKPIVRENGTIKHVVSEKCYPYFTKLHECGICIKVCPFSKVDYNSLKKAYKNNVAIRGKNFKKLKNEH